MNKEIEIPKGYEARIEGNKVIIEQMESKDEKTRKELLAVINDLILPDEQKARFNDWLEKQKEQKPAEKQDYSGLTEFERAIHRGFLLADYRENIPVSIIKETAQDCLSQIKPAEWSDEDEKVIKLIESATWDGEKLNQGEAGIVHGWLKSLRPQPRKVDACGFPLRDEGESACSYLERCLAPDMRHVWYEACSEIREKQETQQPTEWSEKDENHFKACVRAMQTYEGIDTPISKWIKALKDRVCPQSHWKPSELQMFALDSAILMFHNLKRGGDKKELESLSEDLKKL